MKSIAFALSLLAAGLVSAQTAQTTGTTTPTPGPHPHMRPRGNPDDMFEARLTKQLSLNATQQNTVHTALADARVQTKGMMQQMQTLHTEMVTAVKNGDEAGIEKATTDISALRQQQDAIHAKAMAKIYAGLNADQKTKVGTHLEMLMRGGFGPGFGGGPGFGRGRGPASSSTTSTAVKQ